MTNIKYAIDVHSAWGDDLTGVIARHGPDHVVLHSYHGYEKPGLGEIMIRQAQSVRRAGKTLGMYAWAFRGYSPESTVRESVELFREAAGHNPPVVWLDCEIYSKPGEPDFDPGPDRAWLRAAFAECDRQELRSGVYAAQWWLDGYFPGGASAFAEFANRYLWWANWDLVPELTGPRPLSWPTLHAKQWAIRLPNDQEIDRDVFLPELTEPAEGPFEPVPGDVVPAVALAHVAGTSYDVLMTEAARLRDSADALVIQAAEVRRVYEQFLGPWPENGRAAARATNAAFDALPTPRMKRDGQDGSRTTLNATVV